MSDEIAEVAEFERAAAFISEMWSHSGASSEMHVGDLAWGTFHWWPSALGALRLWPDDTVQTEALTMFAGSGVCDLVVRPGAAGLDAAAEALDWAEETRRAAPVGSDPVELRVGRRVQSPEVIDLLHSRGFQRLSSGVPAMSRALSADDRAPPIAPAGYEIREMHEEDLVSRVAVFNAAFPGDGLRTEAYRALQSCSLYRPRLDIVATSLSGDVAAFATLWLDTHNGVVQIEPTGCHPDHRRRGLSRSVIGEALRRSAELGATEALVRHVSGNTAAQALYESCGFTTVCTDTGFTKTLR